MTSSPSGMASVGLTLYKAPTKRAGRKDKERKEKGTGAGKGEPQRVKKATFESTKKKEVGVSDLTLISKISNEAINDNLKKRFENAEIYVRFRLSELDIRYTKTKSAGEPWTNS